MESNFLDRHVTFLLPSFSPSDLTCYGCIPDVKHHAVVVSHGNNFIVAGNTELEYHPVVRSLGPTT